jgi:transposase, IS5 family
MKLQRNIQMSFSSIYIERRTRKNEFYRQIDKIIDWSLIEKEIDKVYKKGQSVDGRPSYCGIILFKMMLMETWFNQSDPAVEDMVNDSLSAMKFCQLELEDDVPDHSTLSRFRKELVEKKAYDRLLKKVNNQLKAKGLMVKQGSAKVDASLTAALEISGYCKHCFIGSGFREYILSNFMTGSQVTGTIVKA